VVLVPHPEVYHRNQIFQPDINPALRALAAHQQLYDIVPIFTRNGRLRPAFLSSPETFRSFSPPRHIYLSDFKAFFSRNEGALRAALSSPKGYRSLHDFKIFMKPHGLDKHTDRAWALKDQVGIKTGKASQAYWRSPAVVVKYGPYAISYTIHNERGNAAQVKQNARNGLGETAEERRSRLDAYNVQARERYEKDKLKNNAKERERYRKKKLESTVNNGKKHKKLCAY
jgi:hypothetical protein